MKILYVTNIPSPYRIDFFEMLGHEVDLTVVFEARRAEGITFDWNDKKDLSFKAVFLSDGNIKEKKIDWNILSYIQSNTYDRIVFTNYAYCTEIAALLKAKLLHIPYIFEIDGGLIKDDSFLKKSFKKFMLSGARLYLSPGAEADKYLIHYGVKAKRIRRYPFTSLKRADILDDLVSSDEKDELRKAIGITEKEVILAVGRSIHSKGFDVLIEAVAKMRNDIGIYIVGGGATEEYLDIIERLNLKNIHFISFKTKKELKDFYKAADVFVLPTRTDVWGLVINEAMACGLPIITTDKCVAGLELIKNNENGFIVQVESISQLAEKIAAILSDDGLRTKMANNNLKKIRKYTIENMIKVHMKILSKYAKQK